jgi:hypothetical protein
MTAVLRRFQDDYEYGMKKEDIMETKLRLLFNDETITNTKTLYGDQFFKWDFESKCGRKWELKSRRNTKWAYPTTIIPCHKTTSGEVFYVFEFMDKKCYIKYDETLFNTFEIRTIKVYRAGRYDPPTDHYCIPCGLLIDF